MKQSTGKAGLRIHPAGIEIRTIVAPTDFSESANHGVEFAARLCQMWGGSLLLLHVSEAFHVGSLAEGVASGRIRRELRQAGQRKLDEYKFRLGKETAIKAYIKEGRAWEEIVKFAQRTRADLIVVGSHGYTGLKRLALGSTAERVVRHATCPVLVVRGRR